MAADQGYAEGQWELGILCGREGDNDKAICYYTLAANKGHAGAAASLGRFYDVECVFSPSRENRFESLRWYQRARELGHPSAMAELQRIIDSLVKSRNANNDADSLVNLGKCYEYGFGVKQNTERAVYFYRLATYQGDLEAQVCLARVQPPSDAAAVPQQAGKAVSEEKDQSPTRSGASVWDEQAKERAKEEVAVAKKKATPSETIAMLKGGFGSSARRT